MRPLLSDEVICTLKSREREYTNWDHKVTGLGVRVRTTGCKSFVFYCRTLDTGKLRKYTLGRTAQLSLDDARQAARDCQREIWDRTDPENN